MEWPVSKHTFFDEVSSTLTYFFLSHIFIVCDNVVKVYNATTTEWVRDLSVESPVIGVEVDKKLSTRLLICDSAGELSHWQWGTGLQETKKVLNLGAKQPTVLAFKLIFFNSCAVVSWRESEDGVPVVATMNYVNNTILFKYDLTLKPSSNICLAVPAKGLNYFCLVQGSRLYVTDIQSSKGARLM